MWLRLPSALAIVRLFLAMGGRPVPGLQARVQRTVEATLVRALHISAAAVFWGHATDGPYGPRKAAMALELAAGVYSERGWDLLGNHRDELYELAVATAAGEVAEEDVAAAFRDRAKPP